MIVCGGAHGNLCNPARNSKEPSMTTPLAEQIRAHIRAAGPLTVEEYMALALGDAEHGYYRTAPAIGREGDFITAPEICQIFGELIGLWAVMVWQSMGCPAPFALVELGPGRGTLMADALRAARVVPAFRAAAEVHLVEISAPLREAQRTALSGVTPHWHDCLEHVPDMPAIVIANEFFDALPIRQLVLTGGVWCERRVGLAGGGLCFIAGEPSAYAANLGLSETAPEGSIHETQPAARPVIAELARRGSTHPLAALIIDYGHTGGFGDTLQALRSHSFADPLRDPGRVDLTAHVDFAALAREACRHGLKASLPLPQGLFLARLGIAERWQRLSRNATPAQAELLTSGVRRLTSPGEMGELFKALALTSAGLPMPEPFQEMRDD
jgi:NADH dehydrogenase [ubiquinone] 1 alpha subcomplex assembly factor 7